MASVLCLLLLVVPAAAEWSAASRLKNSLAQQPPMGWRSWNCFHDAVTQAKMTGIFDAMAARTRKVDGKPTSLLDVGYNNAGLDDAWQACGAGEKGTFYGADGKPMINTTTFPDMKAMVDHGHHLGLHIGFYLNNCICGMAPGTFNASFVDKIYAGCVDTVVENGFDGVKFDSCSPFHNMTRWASLLAAANHPTLDENCHNSDFQDPCQQAKACPSTGSCPYQFWRVSGDIGPSFGSIYNNLHYTIPWQGPDPLSRPGRWAYPDMLEVGNMPTYAEDRTHFGAWCVTSSPLILGLDLTDDTTVDKVWDIITNSEAIAVNKAWAGHPGTLVKNTTAANGDPVEIWSKPLGNAGSLTGGATTRVAVLVMNIANINGNGNGNGNGNSTVTVDAGWLGISSTTGFGVRDIWEKQDLPAVAAGQRFVTDAFGQHDSRFYVFAYSAATASLSSPASSSSSTALSQGTGVPHHSQVAAVVAAADALVEEEEKEEEGKDGDAVGINGIARRVTSSTLDDATMPAGVAACQKRCKTQLGHCCDAGEGGTQCDGLAGRDCGHAQDAPQATCQMGCIIAAHSTTRAACKVTCMDTRVRQPDQPDQWECNYLFAPTNQTFNLCGTCPKTCPPNLFCGVKVVDYECEQGCDLTFGCDAKQVV